jgi:endonuclease/exonuclease/phosphatase family metal-dependent hydrolase
MVLDAEIVEPTLPALFLTLTGLVVVLVVCLVVIAGVPAFGGIWWTFAFVALLLLVFLFGQRLKPPQEATTPTLRQLWFRRILGLGRILLVAVLACWLGLMVWLALCPGGPDPPARSDPSSIRVVTWNIHCGLDDGLPWKKFDWPVRKESLRAAIETAAPDILCVQEATPVQVAFLEEALPNHRRVGIGRDGQAGGGEHCAIYFDRRRFEELDGNTFWLEEPLDQPRAGSALDVKRICTWVRLRDRTTAKTFRAYNTHLYLTESPRRTAAKHILAHIAAGDPKDAILLTADFNASPSAPSRRLFTEAGLMDSAQRAGKASGKPTFQLYGIGLWSIDAILVDERWEVQEHRILKVKPNNVFPSDHFGVLADVRLK